jgi:hypothetical protein
LDIQIQCLLRQHRSFFAGFKVFHCAGISTVLLLVGAHYAALFPGRGIFILVCSFTCQGAISFLTKQKKPIHTFDVSALQKG